MIKNFIKFLFVLICSFIVSLLLIGLSIILLPITGIFYIICILFFTLCFFIDLFFAGKK